jgi:hypothetical protein
MRYLPAILSIGLATTCAISTSGLAQSTSVPEVRERAASGRPADAPNSGGVFVGPPLRWEYWCTCRCGDLYHRMDVPTPACEDLNTMECVLQGQKHALEDCARRLTPRSERLTIP